MICRYRVQRFDAPPVLGAVGLVLVCLGSGGCSAPPPALSENLKYPEEARSENIDIDVFIDASVPIKGFVNADTGGKTNYFREFLDKSGGILSGAWRNPRIRYWRFGAGDPRAIPAVRDFLFGRQEFSEQETRIDRPIMADFKHPPQSNELKIIVTDLFQNDNDVDGLATDLDSKYVQLRNQAVGVAGIRNAFSGEVDDLPGKIPPGGTDSLPFYILALGPIGDVRHALDLILDRIGANNPEAQKFSMIYFSGSTHAQLQHLEVAPPSTGKVEYSSYPSKVKGAAKLGIPYIQIRHRKVAMTLKGFVGKETGVYLGTFLRISPEVKKTVKVWRGGKAVDDSNAADAFSLNLDAASAKDPELTIDGNVLSSGTVYLLEMDTFADRADFSNLKPWYLEIDEVPRIVRNKQFDAAKDGSRPGKTPNLRHLLQTMVDKEMQSGVPIGHYAMYVEVR